jgi:uncharacterized membrane protein
MDFAPYQDVDPERERALSPPPPHGRRSKSPQVRAPSMRSTASPPARPPLHVLGHQHVSAENGFGSDDRGVHFDAFQTSLPLRLDYEAMLAYLLLPPAGPVLLLMTEHKSDYVRYCSIKQIMDTSCAHTVSRFHAWQSSMLFTCIFVRLMVRCARS